MYTFPFESTTTPLQSVAPAAVLLIVEKADAGAAKGADVGIGVGTPFPFPLLGIPPWIDSTVATRSSHSTDAKTAAKSVDGMSSVRFGCSFWVTFNNLLGTVDHWITLSQKRFSLAETTLKPNFDLCEYMELPNRATGWMLALARTTLSAAPFKDGTASVFLLRQTSPRVPKEADLTCIFDKCRA